MVIACVAAPLRYQLHPNHVLTVDTFSPSWAVALPHSPKLSAAGAMWFVDVAVLLAKDLPSSLISELMKLPVLRQRLIHITNAPPEITAALEVGRPDLYWLVATGWDAIKSMPSASMDTVCALTRAVTTAEWNFEANTVSFADLSLLAKRMHVILHPTGPKGTADIIIDGEAGVSCSPRDKMLLAIGFVWAEPVRWIDTLPRCAPPALAQFRNAVKFNHSG